MKRITLLSVRCVWKPVEQSLKGALLVVCKCDVADSFWRGGNDDLSERSRRETVIDDQIFSFVLELARRHSFDIDEEVVQAARAGQARFVTHLSKRSILSQQIFRVFDTDVFQKFFGADARPFFEQALEVELTQVHFARHTPKVGLFPETFIYKRNRFCYSFIICICHRDLLY